MQRRFPGCVTEIWENNEWGNSSRHEQLAIKPNPKPVYLAQNAPIINSSLHWALVSSDSGKQNGRQNEARKR